jgi:4-oxalocrotonate tautomerase
MSAIGETKYMPIVRVQMFPGRSSVMKEFLARAIVDAVADIAGTTREGVHVTFDEVAKEDWAIGPRLTASRETAPPSSDAPAYVSIGRVSVLEGKHDAYLAWRRNSVFPFMASHDGFLGSTLLAVPDDPKQYVIINKWTSQEAEEQYKAKPRETELRTEAKEFLGELFTDMLGGGVVAVFHPRTQTSTSTT